MTERPAAVAGIGTSFETSGCAVGCLPGCRLRRGSSLYSQHNRCTSDMALETTGGRAVVAVADVVDALGGGLLRTLVPAPGVAVTDVVIAEPGDAAADLRGDLVIGAGVADATDAVELIELAGGGRCRRGDPAPRRGPRSRCPSRGEALRRRPAGAGRLGLAGPRGRRDPGDRRPCRRSGLRAGRPRWRGGPPRARRRGRGPGRRPGDHRGRAVAGASPTRPGRTSPTPRASRPSSVVGSPRR